MWTAWVSYCEVHFWKVVRNFKWVILNYYWRIILLIPFVWTAWVSWCEVHFWKVVRSCKWVILNYYWRIILLIPFVWTAWVSCCEEVHLWKLEGRRLCLMLTHRYFLLPPPQLCLTITTSGVFILQFHRLETLFVSFPFLFIATRLPRLHHHHHHYEIIATLGISLRLLDWGGMLYITVKLGGHIVKAPITFRRYAM